MQADIVFLGGDLHTMDSAMAKASALAVGGRRILAVGDDAEIRRYIGDKTRIIDLEGRSLTPGLSDAHCHLYGLGTSLEAIDLRDVASEEAAAEQVLAAAARLSPDEWATGRGWDQNRWANQVFPHRDSLDSKVSDRPVALRRIDGHALWANSAALALAGIDDNTADPAGGKIVRDDAGKATGVLIDNAMELVESKQPAPSRAVIQRRILRAAKIALASGITTVHEMAISPDVARVYQALAFENRLPLRVYAFLAGDLEVARSLGNKIADTDRDGTQFFILRSVKLFVDGALGSRGAAMLAPYSDDPGNTGLWLMSADDLKEAALAVAQSGWQLAVHAIGDAGNRAVLDAFEAAYAAYPDQDLRFRVEHAQILSQDDIPRFAKLGVIASMQPTHATSDMPWAKARIGEERLRGAYAWRSLLDSGAHVAAGSDFPIERVPPLLGIYAAVTRQDAESQPTGGWHPEERMTLEEVLRSFTYEAAYASFEEGARGILKAGYVADLTVYDRPLAADSTLLETQIDMSVVDGAVRFERE